MPAILTILILCALCAPTRGGTMTDLVLTDLAKSSAWQGVTDDPSVAYKGSPSLKWAHAKSGGASTDNIPHDWSGYDCLYFALHSEKATGAQFELVLPSERAESDGFDYYSMRITIDWTGWREFVIPFNELGRSRNPVGWDKIDAIQFSAKGWGHHPDPESVIHIAGVRLGHCEGPGISDAELFDILNLDYPGMEKVKAAVAKGDLEAAKHEFAEHLRNREKPVWKLDWRARPKHDVRPAGVNTENADRVMAGEVLSVNHWHKFDGPIDWNLNPINYREWPWGLNRHQTWQWLVRAYWDTGEEKYARECARQIVDWVKRCPAPRISSGNGTYTWRTIEQGIRVGQSWPDIYCRLLSSPSFTDEAIVTMVKSFVEHARVLTKYPTNGNWLAMEINGLMHVGVLFPEFKEAAGWRKTATDRLYVEVDKQVYPDGAQIELSTGYHQVSLGNFVMAWEIAHLNDVPMPAECIAKVERMIDYDLKVAMPDKTLPGLNDADRINIRPALKTGFQFFPERKDFQWMATDGKEGERPKVGSVALPFAGHLVMRTGWDPDDLYLLMDAGPYGFGHQHEDALHIVVYSHGKNHLVDAMSYHYNDSPWRKYVVSTRGHNTIMVDGLDQHRGGRPREQYVVSKPLPNKWVAGEGFDYASGVFDTGYGSQNLKVTHKRHIFFVKPEYWIVTDFLDPSDAKPHKYESLFHLDALGADVSGKSVRTANTDASNLSIIAPADDDASLRVVSGQETPVVMGWLRTTGYDVRPIPTAIYEKEQSGPASFQYVICPTAKGAQWPITGVKRLDVGSASGVEIAFADGRRDYFVQARKPGSKVKFLDFETDALAAYVRVRDGKVEKAMLAGGTFLNRAGKPVQAEIREITDLSQTKLTHKF